MEQLIQLSYPKAYEISHQIYQTIAEQTGAKIFLMKNLFSPFIFNVYYKNFQKVS